MRAFPAVIFRIALAHAVPNRCPTPPLEILHPGIQRLFVQCFEEGHRDPCRRPDARTSHTLDAAESDLVPCRSNPQHLHASHLRACPWCELKARLGGRDPFPSHRPHGRQAAGRRLRCLCPSRPAPPPWRPPPRARPSPIRPLITRRAVLGRAHAATASRLRGRGLLPARSGALAPSDRKEWKPAVHRGRPNEHPWDETGATEDHRGATDVGRWSNRARKREIREGTPPPTIPPAPVTLPTETNTLGMKLALVPAGEFDMGSPDSEGRADEHPRHHVRITKPFWLGVNKVTVASTASSSRRARTMPEAAGRRRSRHRPTTTRW